SFLVALGIIVIFGVVLLFKPGINFDWKSNGLLFVSGLIWGIGFLAVAIAISQNADIARLAPIYNTNTLITVLLGILILKEVPDATNMFRVISGAVLIVVGAILVSI
ncbi:MAG: GRP family sugar transporter, partial [Nanoarchaeota archaeon]